MSQSRSGSLWPSSWTTLLITWGKSEPQFPYFLEQREDLCIIWTCFPPTIPLSEIFCCKVLSFYHQRKIPVCAVSISRTPEAQQTRSQLCSSKAGRRKIYPLSVSLSLFCTQ